MKVYGRGHRSGEVVKFSRALRCLGGTAQVIIVGRPVLPDMFTRYMP